jgi:hypothetical protein
MKMAVVEPLYQHRDVVAELGTHLCCGIRGVVEQVVQDRRADRFLAQTQLGHDRGHRERMRYLRGAAAPGLALMPPCRDVIGGQHRLEVCVGILFPNGCDELVDSRHATYTVVYIARQ